MLVKFLSFVASVVGTARYKASLLSSVVLVCSLTGVTVVALSKEGTRPRVPEDTADSTEQVFAVPAALPAVNTLRQQPKAGTAVPDTATPPTPSTAADTTPKPAPAAPAQTSPTIKPDKTDLTLIPGGPGETVTVTLDNQGTAVWSASVTNASVMLAPSEHTGSSFVFQVSADSSALPGTEYEITVFADSGDSAIQPAVIKVIIE